MLHIQVDGMDTVRQALAGLGAHAQPALARALYEEALAIMEKSQGLCPVDTGLLRSTGRVETENAPGPGASVKLSYGGNGLAPYAAVVHENVAARHPVGTHHFLSQPLYEATAGMAQRLAASLQAQLRR